MCGVDDDGDGGVEEWRMREWVLAALRWVVTVLYRCVWILLYSL